MVKNLMYKIKGPALAGAMGIAAASPQVGNATPVVTAKLDTDANTLSIHADNFQTGEFPITGIFRNLGIPKSEVLSYTTNSSDGFYLDNSSYPQIAVWSESYTPKDFMDVLIKYSNLVDETQIPLTNFADLRTIDNLNLNRYENIAYNIDRVNNKQVPEPSIPALLLGGLAGLAYSRKKWSRHTAVRQ